jgi:hypothetical protein
MQLKIEFPEAYGPIGDGVSFQARVDGASLACIVTGGALERLDPEHWLDDPLAQFMRNKERLYELARVLINEGQVRERTLMINSSHVLQGR